MTDDKFGRSGDLSKMYPSITLSVFLSYRRLIVDTDAGHHYNDAGKLYTCTEVYQHYTTEAKGI